MDWTRAAAGIDCLLLKGAASMAAGDASPADRYVGDVDLLVPPEAGWGAGWPSRGSALRRGRER